MILSSACNCIHWIVLSLCIYFDVYGYTPEHWWVMIFYRSYLYCHWTINVHLKYWQLLISEWNYKYVKFQLNCTATSPDETALVNRPPSFCLCKRQQAFLWSHHILFFLSLSSCSSHFKSFSKETKPYFYVPLSQLLH